MRHVVIHIYTMAATIATRGYDDADNRTTEREGETEKYILKIANGTL